MNHDRLKAAIREARAQTKHPWKGWDRSRQTELVTLPLDLVNLLLKAASKELQRT